MTIPPSSQSVVSMVDSKVTERAVTGSRRAGPRVMIGKAGGRCAGCGTVVLNWCSRNWRAILAEVVSTFSLIFFGCMTNIPLQNVPYPQPIYGAIGFGFVVSFNIQIFGHISGAHMNPAVSVAALVWGSLSIARTFVYVIAQCIGAIMGYGLLLVVSPVDLVGEGVCVTQVHPGLECWQALIIEVALTSMLNFLNCAVWDPVNKSKQDSVPLKFGLAIAAFSMAGGPFTGASMNPARSLGPALFTGIWKDHWVYWVGPFLGSALPAALYKFILIKRDKLTSE